MNIEKMPQCYKDGYAVGIKQGEEDIEDLIEVADDLASFWFKASNYCTGGHILFSDNHELWDNLYSSATQVKDLVREIKEKLE